MFRQLLLRHLMLGVMLSALGLTLVACNTTAGVGEDVSATGQAVTKAADKVKTGL